MEKIFNTAGDCKPEAHYMVDLTRRLTEIKALADTGCYFTINRARQYGKTTTLRALNRFLQSDYYVVLIDFQTFGAAKFKNENTFSHSFAKSFLRALKRNVRLTKELYEKAAAPFEVLSSGSADSFELKELFESLSDLCGILDRPVVLLIDEIDSASDNQVFTDFLAQLRASYIDRDLQPAIQSVILAGVYDIRNLKGRMRSDDSRIANSPWNVAADFHVNMSFSKEDILGMLHAYEDDHRIEMNMRQIAGLLYEYTSGYPFLVSRLCKLMDEEVSRLPEFPSLDKVWTDKGFHEAVRMILAEKSTLFESLVEKLTSRPELNELLRSLLFTGRSITYNPDDPAFDAASMFGFIKNRQGNAVIANRIFETRLYNLYLSASEMQTSKLYQSSLQDKNRFIVDGHLNMRLILERFVVHFHDLYGNSEKAFIEEEGRKYFLLYLRPIINGTGNFYVESRTRGLRRTDVVVDYRGEQYVIEMKIWHGNEYNMRGEKQLLEYLDYYHIDTGYMVSFNFNQKKRIGVLETVLHGKTLIEAIV